MTNRDKELEELRDALDGTGYSTSSPDEIAAYLHSQGARIIDVYTERIVKLEDGPLVSEAMAAYQKLNRPGTLRSAVESWLSEVRGDESQRTSDVKFSPIQESELDDFERRKAAWPSLCVTMSSTGSYPVPWRPTMFICAMPEQYEGEGVCRLHRISPSYQGKQQ